MRQGNDVGTQYRSGIYTFSEDAARGRRGVEGGLRDAAFGGRRLSEPITTEILPAPTLYFAEEYHQQYLAKVPHGYCGLGGTGVACAAATGVGAG